MLLGAGLAGLGGALAGCSTTAVPYDANEAGVVEHDSPSASATATAAGPAAATASPATASPAPAAPQAASPAPAAPKQGSSAEDGKPDKGAMGPKVSGTVLGTASEIPVGGGKIFAAAKVVVTQPVRGQYEGFSAICTHVGCILSEVADGTIDCPCHGSEFKITTGAVVTGPAPRPLPKKQIEVADGKVVLI